MLLILKFVAKCNPKAHYLAPQETNGGWTFKMELDKPKSEQTNSKVGVQLDEVNLYKLKRKAIDAS